MRRMKRNIDNINNTTDEHIEDVLINIGEKFIDTDLSLQTNQYARTKASNRYSFKPVFLVVCTLLILLFAGFTVKNLLFKNSAYDNSVNNADQNGYVQHLNVSCTKNDVSIKMLGVINDGERVLIQAQILQNGKKLNFSKVNVSGVKLIAASGEGYNFSVFGGGNMNKSGEAGIIEFPAKISKSQTMTFKIKCINNIEGNWELNFPIQGESSKSYPYNLSQTVDGMNFYVSNITVSKTQIKVKVIVTGELVYNRTDGAIYCGKEKGREISAEGYNTGVANQVSEVITYESISLAGSDYMLMDFDYSNPKNENHEPIKYRIKVPLNRKNN